MSDGGGARATVELLLHIHSFKNIDLRSRGHFCVEVVAFPQSSPKSPGVPFRTYCDPSARRSAARGVAVAPVPGDEGQQGCAGTSSAGLPSYMSSLLPIRFTNEKVQLSEGTSFRIHLDADWLETDVIIVEFRLMYRPLPDSTSSGVESDPAPSEETPPPEALKQVGKVTLHAKCASAKGGLHRYHPLVFPQPYLCLLDVTFHMALTAINHPGGPAGIASAIAGNAFPSEDGHPAPRGPISPLQSPATPAGNRTHARSASVGRLSHGERLTVIRPRFRTPGRFRRGTSITSTPNNTSWGGGVNFSVSSHPPPRARVPMTTAALDAAGSALGLATALGYAPAKLERDRAGAARAIFRAAELLYSRHALGLKWSEGTLAVAEAAATAASAEVAAAAVNAAEKALATARRRGIPFTRSKSAIGSGRSERSRTQLKSEVALVWAGDGHLGYSSDGGSGGAGPLARRNSAEVLSVAPSAGGHRYRKSITSTGETAAKGKPPTATRDGGSGGVSAGPAAGMAGAVRTSRSNDSGGVKKKKNSAAEERLDADEDSEVLSEAWTWEGPTSEKEEVDMKKMPLPSDIRQLSRLIHIRLKEESKVCSRSWAAFAAATFECGRRGMYMLREQWVRETQRAWSGQCLENLSLNRTDLLRLDESLLDPDGFIPLRARAGIRLRRRASPTRGGGRLRKRPPRDRDFRRMSSVLSATAPAQVRKPGSTVVKKSSLSAAAAAEPRILANGRYSRRSRARSRGLEGMRIETTSAAANNNKNNKHSGNCEDGRDDANDEDDRPPLLNPLERRLSQPFYVPGVALITPRSSPSASSWNGKSPWGGSSAASSFRNDGQGSGWFSRLSAGGQSPVRSVGGSASAGEERASGALEYSLAAMTVHFPPPPMSLLALFNRDLHGYDAAAPDDDKWAELPFVVVESWGGVEVEELQPSAERDLQSDAPMSLISPPSKSNADEYRRFKRIASGNFPETPCKMDVETAANGIASFNTNSNKHHSMRTVAGRHTNDKMINDIVALKSRHANAPHSNVPVVGRTPVTKTLTPPPTGESSTSTVSASPPDDDDDDAPPGLPDLVVSPSMSKASTTECIPNAAHRPRAPNSSSLPLSTIGDAADCRLSKPSKLLGSTLSFGASAMSAASVAAASAAAAATAPIRPNSPIRMTLARRARSGSYSRSPSLSYSSPTGPDSPLFSAASVSSSTSSAVQGPPRIDGTKLLMTPARTRVTRSLSSPASIFDTLSLEKWSHAGSRRRGPGSGGLRSPVITKAKIFGTPARIRAVGPRSPVNLASGIVKTPGRTRVQRSPAKQTTAAAAVSATPPRLGAATPPRAPRSPTGADGGDDDNAGSIWDASPGANKKGKTKTSNRLRKKGEVSAAAGADATRRPVRQFSLPPREDLAVVSTGGLWGTGDVNHDTDNYVGGRSGGGVFVGSSRSTTSGGTHDARPKKLGLLARAESLGSDFGGFVSSSDNDDGSYAVNDGRKRTKTKKRRKSKRAEIRRKMWGRRPEWATALLAKQPGATGAAALEVGGSDAQVASAVSAATVAGAVPPPESGANHLVVLVHGLGGRPPDMALLRGFLQTLMPGAELMVATSLQDVRKENSGVEALGRKLAEEVDAHIQRFCPYFASNVPIASSKSPNDDTSLPLSPVTPMRPARGGKKKKAPGTPGTPGLGGESRRDGSRRHSRRGSGSGKIGDHKGILSFVCFSMGGLVARSALLEAAMVPYLDCLHCFVTLACPHLGQTSTPLSFFKTGAWAFRKLTGLKILHELDLDDADDPRETVLYRLSFSPGLERFRTVVFAANPRDGFVPLHSASVRLAPPSMDSTDSRTRGASAEMAEMLMSKVDERKNRVVRMTLDDPRRQANSKSMVESVIGRAGHMCFIDSPQVAWLISLALLPFMEESSQRR